MRRRSRRASGTIGTVELAVGSAEAFSSTRGKETRKSKNPLSLLPLSPTDLRDDIELAGRSMRVTQLGSWLSIFDVLRQSAYQSVPKAASMLTFPRQLPSSGHTGIRLQSSISLPYKQFQLGPRNALA